MIFKERRLKTYQQKTNKKTFQEGILKRYQDKTNQKIFKGVTLKTKQIEKYLKKGNF